MGPTYLVATAAVVTREELQDLIRAEDGWDDDVYDGCVSSAEACVCINWATESRAKWVEAHRGPATGPVNMGEREEVMSEAATIVAKLGSEPRSFIQLDLMTHNYDLAWHLIQASAARWGPCVVSSDVTRETAEQGRRVWTMHELAELWEQHQRLPGSWVGDVATLERIVAERRAALQARWDADHPAS